MGHNSIKFIYFFPLIKSHQCSWAWGWGPNTGLDPILFVRDIPIKESMCKKFIKFQASCNGVYYDNKKGLDIYYVFANTLIFHGPTKKSKRKIKIPKLCHKVTCRINRKVTSKLPSCRLSNTKHGFVAW